MNDMNWDVKVFERLSNEQRVYYEVDLNFIKFRK